MTERACVRPAEAPDVNPVLADLPFLDVDGDAYAADPVAVLRALHARSPLASSTRGIEVLGYRSGSATLRDRRLDTNHMELIDRYGFPEGPALEYKRRMLLSTDGKEHSRLRMTLSARFSPQQAERSRHEVRAVVDRLLDAVDPTEPFDLFDAVCSRVPAEVYCQWVDAPPSDVPFVMRTSDAVLRIFEEDPADRDTILAGYAELIPYMEAQVAERRQHLGDDLLSHLIRQQAEGRLSGEEVVDQAVMTLEASTDNTAHQMALVVGTLLEHPDQWKALTADPSLVARAVEEAIRLNPRSLVLDRYCRADVEIDGVAIPEGSRLVVNVIAGQRDPNEFEDPDELSLERSGPGPLTFGGGAYVCLGAPIARLEIEVLLHALVQRFPAIHLAGDVVTARTPFTAASAQLPVALT
ncbi:MAG: cytochrome [Acidimicrobiales bacterium]|nr:cytochrome [Acidimicrobiales bacterium]